MDQQIKTPKEFYQDLQGIFAPDSTGLEHLKSITKNLFSIIKKASQVNSDETAELIGAWVLGTKENRFLENKSAYDHYIIEHNELKNYIAQINSPNFSRDLLAKLFIDDFENSFELDRKILVNLVCIDRLLNSKAYSLENLYFESAGSLINRLKQSDTDWDFLIDCLDKRIRNASSHLNFYYDNKSSSFKGKDVNARSKEILYFTISPEELLNTLLPQQCNVIQAFIACGILLWLSVNDENVYNKAINLLN
ncbi:hypothetical protein [Lactobacillus crispatus]|uniref:hypothetical protein n=1 Tax=Lactobacillus crispatus TaxID=47770 RepID=UPI0001B29DF2|nr:hypothetical protein [Lactobacillus crispatus]EEU18659.1 hypothetical protein HMPREF5045_01675 [Lactobacillus crispatus 125-2-CHN]